MAGMQISEIIDLTTTPTTASVVEHAEPELVDLTEESSPKPTASVSTWKFVFKNGLTIQYQTLNLKYYNF